MFSIDLPAGACLAVTLPNGTQTAFVHAGGGRFLSKVPPLFMHAARPGPAPEVPDLTPLPISWDGVTLPGDGPTHGAVIVFDAAAGMAALQAAGDAGDTFAKAVLDEVAAAQRTMEARMSLAGLSGVSFVGSAAANDVPADNGNAPPTVVVH